MLNDLYALIKNLKILLVEDEDDLREILAQTLSPYVNKIYEAKNGISGLDIFLNKDVDLIISDINMPKLSGTKMAAMIREYNRNMPIIFLTAYDSEENILKAIKLNNSNLLKKPFDKKQLLTAIFFLIGKESNSQNIINLKNDFKYNRISRELFLKDKLIPLTNTERRLLFLLIANNNHQVSFNMIENFVWQAKGATEDSIRTFIKKLRKKIYPELIINIQGYGYLLKI